MQLGLVDNTPRQDEFEAWWAEYPRKQQKGDARRAWWETRKIRPETAQMITALRAQKQSDQWIRGFVPNPAKYLRSECWEDVMEIETENPRVLEERMRQVEQEARAVAERRRAEWEALSPEEKMRRIAARRAA